jgi:hypothetical protein
MRKRKQRQKEDTKILPGSEGFCKCSTYMNALSDQKQHMEPHLPEKGKYEHEERWEEGVSEI